MAIRIFCIDIGYRLVKMMYVCSVVVHVGSIRQTATILTMSRDHLRTGDKATCKFRFIKHPEYMKGKFNSSCITYSDIYVSRNFPTHYSCRF